MEFFILLLLIAVVVGEFLIMQYVKYEPEESTKEKPKLTKEEKKRQEELRKNFENLMNYGYEDALKKKE